MHVWIIHLGLDLKHGIIENLLILLSVVFQQPIKGYISNMYIHSYYQIDPASINNTRGIASDENNESSESLEHAMALTLYFVSTFHSAMDNIFHKPPSKPPDSLIKALIMIPITWICISSQSIIACVHIMKQKHKTKRKWHRKISAEVAARLKSKKKSRRALLKFCRKHLVIQKKIVQKAKTSDS